MKLTSIPVLAAILAIGAGGFIAGRVSSSDDPASTAASDRNPVSRSARSAVTSSTGESAADRLRQAREKKTSLGNTVDRQTRLESIMRSENPVDRSRALLAYIDQLAPSDFEAAVEQFRSLGLTESRMGEYAILLSAWAKADPLGALAFAQENTRSPFAKDTILTTWAANDPDAAINWAKANHEGDGANPNLIGVIRGLAESDPQRATQLLSSMPFGQERGQALDAMLPFLVAQGTDAVRSWADSLADPALRQGAIARAAEQLATKDPQASLAWLLSNPGDATKARIDDVYRTWAGNDSDAALASLSTLAPGETRSDALRGVVGSLAAKDPATAVAVMDRFPNEVNDQVVSNFVWFSFRNDPASAVSQIQRIENQGQRDQMYRRTVGRWMQNDPTAASAWLQTSALPQEIQQQIQQRSQR